MIAGVDYPGVTCTFLIHDDKGRVLMGKRGANCRDEQGRWDVGSGAVDFGEDHVNTVIREVKEEYCLDITEENLHLLGVRTALREREGKPCHWVAVDYAVKVAREVFDAQLFDNGEPHKIDEVGVFTLNTLPSPLHSTFEQYRDKYHLKYLTYQR